MNAYVPTKILEVMNLHCRGRENVRPRAWIEDRLLHWAIDITDRKIRAHYSTLPICSCEDGIFIPTRPEEVVEYEAYLRRKQMAESLIQIKIRRILATWPNLSPTPKYEQLNLGLGLNA